MSEVISIKNLTKDFGEGRGLFDVSLNINKGEVFGLVGINGSGKTTLMRHLMGFLKPDSGKSYINDMDCWTKADEIKRQVGYIPGEISFPDVNSGTEFLKLQAEYMGLKNMDYATELTKKLYLDPTAKLKRMSKGMKQKTALVNAFMTDSQILLLDEPTTGLDPLMQKAFNDIVLAEKKKGKTIFMSSHMFTEMEHTCDRVAFLKNGKILSVIDMNTIKGDEKVKEYKIEFTNKKDYADFIAKPFKFIRKKAELNQVSINIPDKEINMLFKVLSKKQVRFITHKPYTLEACFKDIYNNNTENTKNTEVLL